MSFQYTSGDPSHLTGGANASMSDIQGPFTDLKTFLNNRIAAIPTLVSSLPVSPADGQEIYYQADATNGVIWHLRYRAASASSFKWECVGGGYWKVAEQTNAANVSTIGGSWSDLTTNVDWVATISGEFEVLSYSNLAHNGSGTAVMGMGVATTAGSPVDGGQFAIAPAVAATIRHWQFGVPMTAGTTYRLRYVAVGGALSGATATGTRNFRIRPIRVG